MAKLTFGVFVAISFLFNGYSMHKTGSPIQALANIASYFKSGQICGHKCDVFVSHDEYSRWNIRLTVVVKNGEDPDKLCKCMHDYINQNNWLRDVTHVCVHSCDILTFILVGPSNPHDNPHVTPFTKPISALCSTLENFQTAEIGDYACTSKCDKHRELTRLKLQCKLTCELPSPATARESIVKYLSQNGLLANANITAKGEAEYLEVIISGK